MDMAQLFAVQDGDLQLAADAVASDADADIYLYNDAIRRGTDELLISACSKRHRRTNVILILVTEGGDPDAAFRIARCFQNAYKRFVCLVAGYCKSAGTLIAVGAHELVIDDAAELGPLDVQMSKRDELWEMQSGLTVTVALNALQQSSFSAFEHFFLSMKRRSNNAVTLKTATEIAAKLTAGLFTPIYQQIDPMYVGEAQRAQAIAQQYGRRLASAGENLSVESLDRLIASYPTHGFVIDRAEAEALFHSVRKPNGLERHLLDLLGIRASVPEELAPENRFLSSELTSGEWKHGDDVKQSENPQDSSARGSDGALNASSGGDA